VIAQLTTFVARIKSLTIRCEYGLLPLWKRSPDEDFPPSPTLERMRIITAWPILMMEEYAIMDVTFSNTDRYPSLKEFEVCSDLEVQSGKGGRDAYRRLYMGEYLPRLRASGRLSA